MASEDALRASLQSNYAPFEGLMSLTPAKYYYGEDNDDQWQRKKQTKEQKKAARKAKLDPKSYKSALDVHRENELKRKRDLEDDGGNDNIEQQTPFNSIKAEKQSKKQKRATPENKEKKLLTPEEDAAVRQAKAEKRRLKRERKSEKKTRQKAATEAKRSKKASTADSKQVVGGSNHGNKTNGVAGGDDSDVNDDSVDEDEEEDNVDHADSTAKKSSKNLVNEETDSHNIVDAEIGEKIDLDDFHHGPAAIEESDEPESPEADATSFDGSASHSSSSSISSIVPPLDSAHDDSTITEAKAAPTSVATSQIDTNQQDNSDARTKTDSPSGTGTPRQRAPKLPLIDTELLRERLEARISALRAARKADGPDGKPARNRQELIEARRQKQEKRKQHKKELRAQARKDNNEAEAEAARLRGGSGSPLWSTPSLLSPRTARNNFSFGRVAFEDGQELDTSMSGTVDLQKKKGPQDPKTALEAAQKKQSRLSALDAEKRGDIEDKERWLNAKKRVHGEKVRDNTSLLKKTLKRHEKGKKKSEKEWNERIDGVKKGMELKQKRREENLAKRKEEKGNKGKGKGKGKPSAAKPKKRPGFEGSLRIGSKRGQ